MNVRVTQYVVNAYPDDGDVNATAFEVTVDYRGRERWAVRHGGRCLSRRDDDWDWESIPSERAEDWLQDHRFSLGEALSAAKRVAPRIRVNGKTAAEVAEWAAAL